MSISPTATLVNLSTLGRNGARGIVIDHAYVGDGIARASRTLDALSNPLAEEVARLFPTELTTPEIAKQTGVPMPMVIKIKKFYEAILLDGCLVQRKSGSDFFGSIPNLFRILEKMRVWTRHPWLLTTGIIEETPTRRVKVDGREFDWSYASIMGSITMWQERVGYVFHLSHDRAINEWLKKKEERINRPPPPRIITVREPTQYLISDGEADAWVTTLLTFKGVGTGLAKKIAEQFGTLADALCFLSDPTAPKWDFRPDGFGPITSRYARIRLGLAENEYLRIIQDNPTDENGKG